MRVIASAPRKPITEELKPLDTIWSEQVASGKYEAEDEQSTYDQMVRGSESAAGNEMGLTSEPLHPHPQFYRKDFQLLNGYWNYCIVPDDNAEEAWQSAPLPSEWEGTILVPFSPEAPLSQVGRQLKPDELLWYQRRFSCPAGLGGTDDDRTAAMNNNKRCILHFEAVDYACACYCNGVLVGTHVGGYLPFSFDITDELTPGQNELALCVYDPSDTGVQLRGKQKLERGGIWFTAQSGIWQTVWLEVVPNNHIESLIIDANADTGCLTLSVTLCERTIVQEGEPTQTALTVRLFDGEKEVATATCNNSSINTPHPSAHSTPAGLIAESGSNNTLTLVLASPHLWSPADPHLYQLELSYQQDTVNSYCAFRTISMEDDEGGIKRLCINHEPFFLRGVLDQGYWPDGLMTAPSDEALVFDIQAMKDMGFNTLRKHIKIESDRWYYHCDRLGMLVLQDMVSGGSPPKSWYISYKPTFFRCSWGRYADMEEHYHNLSSENPAFRAEWTQTCVGAIEHLRNHPSVITWVLFNEGWGQFDARQATALVRELDPTRPIDAASGWFDQGCGDLLSVHNYFRALKVYKDRVSARRAFIISEFGGATLHLPEHSVLSTSYGYETYYDAEQFSAAVQKTLEQASVLKDQGLAGFVYTQLSDVEEETNGLLSYDRRVNKLKAD